MKQGDLIRPLIEVGYTMMLSLDLPNPAVLVELLVTVQAEQQATVVLHSDWKPRCEQHSDWSNYFLVVVDVVAVLQAELTLAAEQELVVLADLTAD